MVVAIVDQWDELVMLFVAIEDDTVHDAVGAAVTDGDVIKRFAVAVVKFEGRPVRR